MTSSSTPDSILAAPGKYVEFSGRARRKEFWWFFLFCCVGDAALLVLDISLGLYYPGTEVGVFSGIFSLATFLPLTAVATRRLHDIGKSGWLLLIAFVPLIGAVALITFWLRASCSTDNQYGPSTVAAT